MALISPILDNRTYEQLREELVRRIPACAPLWTDHNASDPGIALLELFAYLGESLLYRFNQIPDATKVEFLRLLGVQPRTARTARVLLAVSTELAEGVQLLAGREATGPVPFETEDEVYAWPLDVIGVGKAAVPPATTAAERDRREHARIARGLAPEDPAGFYDTAEVPADPLAPGAEPLDVDATLDRSLWIALLRKPATDLTRLAGRTISVGVAFDETIARPFSLQALDADDAAVFRSANLGEDPPAMLWRLWNGTNGFTNLEVAGDTTGGMVTTGVVKLTLPRTLPDLSGAPRPAGGADSPPPLADERKAALVVAWLQVSRPRPVSDAIRRVRWVGLNAVGATQARSAAAPELLGAGTGDSGQQAALTRQRVLPGTVRLQVEEGPEGWRDWQEVPGFIRSGPGDRHFAVDYETGIVHFGHGRVPQPGERIRVLSYRYGGGIAGNTGAGTITAISGPGPVRVTNPLPAAGGAEPASLAEALDAIPAEVHRRDRAVIAADFSELAAQVTGVARAETLPLLHPDTPAIRAAGVVSVVVFPPEDRYQPNAPMPDHALLRRVARYLDERRLVTTELYVIPPTYRRITVSAGVRVKDGYQVDAVRRWVELILRQYLAPLPPYGPDGSGWPLGRAVRRAELEAIAVQVDGVEYLEGLILTEPPSVTPSQLVELERWEVPELADITVTGGQPLPPGVPYEPAPPDAVPVPLPPEVC
ncbi:putative baseplate assembly protein [Longispora albida]|uniref:putative baseplate assembly protein n=1 Tax=Longispora albida TaxID=203523 RepID=UPI00035F7BFC|nr:putative baseplate assembly protein [Longispora albida]